LDWDLPSWVSDAIKGFLVQSFSISFGIMVLGLAYIVFGIQYFILQPVYSALNLPHPFESILNSIGMFFIIGWFIGFLIMTVVITEKEEIESLGTFFFSSFIVSMVLMSLINLLNFINGFVWGLILSVIGVMIMYLFKVFSEHNEL
jgi:simple sugar transport system permease protein